MTCCRAVAAFVHVSVAETTSTAFVWIGAAAFSAAGPLRQNATTGLPKAGATGDGLADLQIRLLGSPVPGLGELAL